MLVPDCHTELQNVGTWLCHTELQNVGTWLPHWTTECWYPTVQHWTTECWYLTATLNYRILVPDCATLNYRMLVPDCATLNVIFYTQSFSHRQVLPVERLATGCTVRGSNPGGGEIFRTRPDRLCGPPSPLYNGYRVSFPGGRRRWSPNTF
jgi:hypothetical protein